MSADVILENLDQLLAASPSVGLNDGAIYIHRVSGVDYGLTGAQLRIGIIQALIPEVVETTYNKGDMVSDPDGIIYVSKIDGNDGAPPSTNWLTCNTLADALGPLWKALIP